MADQSKADISTPSLAYRDMEARWAPCVALMGGTETMRAAAQTYLPMFPKEGSKRYDTRLGEATLYEAYARTIESLSGRPFSRPPALSEGASQYFTDYVDDVDLQGSSLGVFARACLRDMLVYGKCHILAEYPNAYLLQQTLGRPLTLADQNRYGLRSYLVRLSPDEVIGWEGHRDGGKERLTSLRLRLKTVEKDPDDPWGEVEREYIVHWTNDLITSYTQNDKDEWVLASEPAPNTLGRIPLVTVYTRRLGLLTAYPPLGGLAWLNVKHWQQSSDQDQIEKMARVPLIFFKGFSETDMDSAEIGPFKALSNRSPDSDVKIIEPNGAAVKVGRDALNELVLQMEDMAMQPLRRRPGNPTATELSLQAGRNICDLEVYVMLLERGLGEALATAAEWDGQTKTAAPEVKIDQDFGYTFGVKDELTEIREDRKLGEIDRRTYLWERKRRGLYSEDMDIDAVIQAVEDEEPKFVAPPPEPFKPGGQAGAQDGDPEGDGK
jgi:hypothetical protein